MNPTLTLVACLAAFSVILLIGLLVAGKPKNIGARLKELTSTDITATVPSAHISGRREDAIPLLTRLLTGRRVTERLYVELSAAGLPIRPSEFVGILGGSVILSQMLALAVVHNIYGHLLLGVIGVVLPTMIVKSLQTRRRAAFDAQIVDTLTTMSSSFRAGFSLLRAMQMVSQEMPPPISKEFERIVNEVGVGRPLEEALRASVARVGSYDFDLVVTAILIQLQVGGNIAEILETIASTIRERTKITGEMRALTAEGRISGLVLVILPIALALILCWMRPEYMSTLLTDPVGPHLIGTAAILQVIGVIIMRRLLTLEI